MILEHICSGALGILRSLVKAGSMPEGLSQPEAYSAHGPAWEPGWLWSVCVNVWAHGCVSTQACTCRAGGSVHSLGLRMFRDIKRENQSSHPTLVLTMAPCVEPRNCHFAWMYLLHVTTNSSFSKPPNEYKVSEIPEWLILSTCLLLDNPFYCH